MSFNLDCVFSSFHCSPMDLLDVFKDDLNGVYINRLCPVPIVPL